MNRFDELVFGDLEDYEILNAPINLYFRFLPLLHEVNNNPVSRIIYSR